MKELEWTVHCEIAILSGGKSTEISMQESIDFCTFLHNLQFQQLNDYDVLVTAGEKASQRSDDKIQVAELLDNPGVHAQKITNTEGQGK